MVIIHLAQIVQACLMVRLNWIAAMFVQVGNLVISLIVIKTVTVTVVEVHRMM